MPSRKVRSHIEKRVKKLTDERYANLHAMECALRRGDQWEARWYGSVVAQYDARIQEAKAKLGAENGVMGG